MKRVYSVVRNREYGYFYPTPEGPIGPFNGHLFLGVPVQEQWVPPKVYKLYPLRKTWDIGVYLNLTAIVITQRARDQLGVLANNPGIELLHFTHGGENYYVVNVLEMPNCLETHAGSDILTRMARKTLSFYPKRFTRSLFKIPELPTNVLVAEDDTRPDWSFKYQCENRGIEGVAFDLLWQGD